MFEKGKSNSIKRYWCKNVLWCVQLFKHSNVAHWTDVNIASDALVCSFSNGGGCREWQRFSNVTPDLPTCLTWNLPVGNRNSDIRGLRTPDYEGGLITDVNFLFGEFSVGRFVFPNFLFKDSLEGCCLAVFSEILWNSLNIVWDTCNMYSVIYRY